MMADAKKIKKGVKLEDELVFDLETKEDYGRIAAQTAKQVIIQKIREAERGAIIDEYGTKEGEIIREIDNYGTSPSGYNVGGANPLIFQDSSGARISDYITTVKLSSGITGSVNDGILTLTTIASTAILTATGTINDSNTDFTFVSLPSVIIMNGATYQQTGGAITWTWNAGTLTASLSSPVGTGGSLFGIS